MRQRDREGPIVDFSTVREIVYDSKGILGRCVFECVIERVRNTDRERENVSTGGSENLFSTFSWQGVSAAAATASAAQTQPTSLLGPARRNFFAALIHWAHFQASQGRTSVRPNDCVSKRFSK